MKNQRRFCASSEGAEEICANSEGLEDICANSEGWRRFCHSCENTENILSPFSRYNEDFVLFLRRKRSERTIKIFIGCGSFVEILY